MKNTSHHSLLTQKLCYVAAASALNIPYAAPRVARHPRVISSRMDEAATVDNSAGIIADREKFWLEFEIPKKGIAEYGTCQANLAPLLESSECITLTTELPFGLAAEPKDGLVVVTKEGVGGEREGDVLRFFSAWKQGPGGPIAQPDMIVSIG